MKNEKNIHQNEKAEQPVLLHMEDIEKSFPGVKALDRVSLTVKAGTVHALMGENGAGKSTLMKCLFGVYSKDSGKITLNGEEVNFKNSKEALEHGVAMVHQELNQALKRNVMDNMWLGRFPTVAKGVPLTSEKKMYNATKEVFDRLGISVNPKTVMSKMPVSQRQMVEIAKAVSYHAKVIVFDEPTSSLTEDEVEHLFRIIDMLKKEGCGIIYISHKMKEILRISDEVTIMRDGKWVATRPASELTTDDIIRLMVGRELTNVYPPKNNQIGDVLLEVEHLSAMYSNLRDVSFQAHRGEIIGIAGLDGSGRSQLLQNLFGVSTKKEGKILLDGKPVKNRRTACHRNFRHSQHSGKCHDFQFGSMQKRAVYQQGAAKKEHRLVHPFHADQNAQSGNQNSFTFRRKSAKGHFGPLAADRTNRSFTG